MDKLNHIKTFGNIIVKNYDFRPMLSEIEQVPYRFGLGVVRVNKRRRFRGRGEKSYFQIDGKIVGYGQNTWINRSWQCFDFQTSTYHAYMDTLDTIDWKTYEKYRRDLQAIHEYIKD